jgi:hypothetical protein
MAQLYAEKRDNCIDEEKLKSLKWKWVAIGAVIGVAFMKILGLIFNYIRGG